MPNESEKINQELLDAIKSNDLKKVKNLLKAGLNLEIRDSMEMTPLTHSVIIGNKKITKKLVENGADINAKDKFGRTPFMHAASKGHKDIFKYLLENGADSNLKDSFGKSADELSTKNKLQKQVKIPKIHGEGYDYVSISKSEKPKLENIKEINKNKFPKKKVDPLDDVIILSRKDLHRKKLFKHTKRWRDAFLMLFIIIFGFATILTSILYETYLNVSDDPFVETILSYVFIELILPFYILSVIFLVGYAVLNVFYIQHLY